MIAIVQSVFRNIFRCQRLSICITFKLDGFGTQFGHLTICQAELDNLLVSKIGVVQHILLKCLNNNISFPRPGVGGNIDLPELEQIASDPDSTYLLRCNTFHGIWSLAAPIADVLCTASGGSNTDTEYIFLIGCLTSYVVFSIAVLPHSSGVVYYHLLLTREIRIPGVVPFSFQIRIRDFLSA